MAASSKSWRARFLQACAPLLLHIRAPLLLAAATLLAYSNSLSGGFPLDSRQAVLGDSRVHAVTAENLDRILNHTYWWPYDSSGLYRPLTTFSYLFNYATLGNRSRPAGYHWTNLLLHLANVLLVYALARRLTRYAFAAALLWAVHPVLTESVANLAGRADLLAAFGMLAALWFYTARPRGWFWGMMAATVVGVFSKESAVVLPALLPLFDRNRRRLLAGLGATAVPIAAMLAQRASVLASSLPYSVPVTDNPTIAADFLTAKLAALSVLGRYVWLLVWPARLSADYSWAQIPAAANWAALATLAAVVAAGAIWNWRALVFAALAILPASNLLFPAGTIMAERLLYVPAIVFALALAQLWRWPAGRAALCAIAVAFAARAWVRNRDWLDDRTMAESLVRTSPLSYKAHRLLASELFAAHADPARAVEEAAKSIAPLDAIPDIDNSPDTWRLAGDCYAAAGKYERSAEIFERCLRIVNAQKQRTPDAAWPALGDTLEALASDYRSLGRNDDAAVTLMVGQLSTGDLRFRKELLDLYRGISCAIVPGPAGPAIDPQCPAVHDHLCRALAKAGRSGDFAAYGCKK